MRIAHTFTTARTALAAHKSRSSLTILGIVIGITAIMLMMSIGSGAEKLILNEISGLGTETIVIRPGREPQGPTDVAGTLLADSLKKRDVEALMKKSNVPDLVSVMPALLVPGNVSYGGETFSPTIFGGSVEFLADAFQIYPEKGMVFTDADIAQRATVAVIGSRVEEELFGNASALGKQITIKNKKFRVVGIFPPKGQIAFLNINELVVVPYTSAQSYLLGIDYFHEIITKASTPEAVERTVKDIEITLRQTHGITDPGKDDFFVVTQQGVVAQVRTIIGALTAFLSSVVAIALVVGGIGVMNIMLVSVTERTREIGLRKALGATNHDILTQFLFESIMLTALGGIIGILLGALLSFLAGIVLTRVVGLTWEFSFPLSAGILGLSVSGIVGLIFGIYPARQAAQKSPIEALRYE